jgi:hypothetical protein
VDLVFVAAFALTLSPLVLWRRPPVAPPPEDPAAEALFMERERAEAKQIVTLMRVTEVRNVATQVERHVAETLRTESHSPRGAPGARKR